MTKIAVFGSDAAEAAQVKRIKSFVACGLDVQGFMMRRDNMNKDFVPFWPNLHLGDVANEDPVGRVKAVGRAMKLVIQNRALLKGTDVIVGRGLDLLAVAALAKWLAPGKPQLVYECLDIHTLATGEGRKNKLFRWIERRLLARTDTLVISAPAFLKAYFEPRQGWAGRTVLVENKIWADDPATLPRPTTAPDRPPITADAPLTLGWIGTLRCQDSLDLLIAAADALGPQVHIQMHGVVHEHAIGDLDAVVAGHPNITFYGPYDYPTGLAAVYSSCDAVWSQDLWQWGTNSSWLLPNRIYEASYFGCPSIAVAKTGTGDRVEDGLGWTIPTPSADALIALLQSLTAEDLTAKRRDILARPTDDFLLNPQEIRRAFVGPDG